MSTYQCPGCGYTYNEVKGEPHDGFAPGTQFTEIPEDLSCPDCGVRDFVDFEKVAIASELRSGTQASLRSG